MGEQQKPIEERGLLTDAAAFGAGVGANAAYDAGKAAVQQVAAKLSKPKPEQPHVVLPPGVHPDD